MYFTVNMFTIVYCNLLQYFIGNLVKFTVNLYSVHIKIIMLAGIAGPGLCG